LERQVLRLVDDQHVVLLFRVGGKQKIGQPVDVFLDGCGVRRILLERNVEFLADRLQQFVDGQFRIENVGDVAVGRNLAQKAAAYGGLARADFSRQQHETAAAVHSIQQMSERLAMTLAHEEIARVGRDRKRSLLEVEEAVVHDVGQNAEQH